MNNYQALRMWLTMTRRELAERLGVTTALIAMWENGTRRPSLDNLQALARIANIRLDEVLTFDIEIKRKEAAENDVSLHTAATDHD